MGNAWDDFKGTVSDNVARARKSLDSRFGADNVDTAINVGKHLVLPGAGMLLGKLVHGKKYNLRKAMLYGLGGAAADFALNGYGNYGGWGRHYFNGLRKERADAEESEKNISATRNSKEFKKREKAYKKRKAELAAEAFGREEAAKEELKRLAARKNRELMPYYQDLLDSNKENTPAKAKLIADARKAADPEAIAQQQKADRQAEGQKGSLDLASKSVVKQPELQHTIPVLDPVKGSGMDVKKVEQTEKAKQELADIDLKEKIKASTSAAMALNGEIKGYGEDRKLQDAANKAKAAKEKAAREKADKAKAAKMQAKADKYNAEMQAYWKSRQEQEKALSDRAEADVLATRAELQRVIQAAQEAGRERARQAANDPLDPANGDPNDMGPYSGDGKAWYNPLNWFR